MTGSKAKVHVLLVDDEVEFLSATSTALRRRGFIVSTAPDGDAALRLLHRDIIDVAVLDVKMPGLTGDELYQVMRARWPDTPVLMLTGHGTISQAFQLSREGVVEYLAKPCDVETLARSLRKAVARRNARTRQDNDDSADELRVLVVDDEQELLDVLSPTLSRRGVFVETARTGTQTLELLAAREIDVVLLDLKLQREHGLDLLDEIKRSHPSTEVILHTGHPSAESAVDALKRGAFDFLSKPTDMGLLLEKIREAHRFRRRQLAQQRDRKIRSLLRERPD